MNCLSYLDEPKPFCFAHMCQERWSSAIHSSLVCFMYVFFSHLTLFSLYVFLCYNCIFKCSLSVKWFQTLKIKWRKWCRKKTVPPKKNCTSSSCYLHKALSTSLGEYNNISLWCISCMNGIYLLSNCLLLTVIGWIVSPQNLSVKF